jgi:hypothetical protein
VDEQAAVAPRRYCERSEAIQLRAGRRAQKRAELVADAAPLFGALRARWIASSLCSSQ